MHCIHCGTRNPAQAHFCMNCGRARGAAGLQGRAPEPFNPRWTDVLAVTALILIGVAGIYMHPLLEPGVAVYIALGASAIWVFADAPRQNKPRWPWTLGTVALWIFIFPAYLGKTRGARGLIPGLAIVGIVVGLQFFPQIYSAKKHFQRGLIYAGQQRLTKAEEEFRAAIRRNSSIGEARLNLGILYMSQGLLDAAEKELTEARALIEKNGVRFIPGTKNQALSLCLANLAAVYAMRTSESIQTLDRTLAKAYFAKAESLAEEAVKLDADNVRSAELVRRLQQLRSFLD